MWEVVKWAVGGLVAVGSIVGVWALRRPFVRFVKWLRRLPKIHSRVAELEETVRNQQSDDVAVQRELARARVTEAEANLEKERRETGDLARRHAAEDEAKQRTDELRRAIFVCATHVYFSDRVEGYDPQGRYCATCWHDKDKLIPMIPGEHTFAGEDGQIMRHYVCNVCGARVAIVA